MEQKKCEECNWIINERNQQLHMKFHRRFGASQAGHESSSDTEAESESTTSTDSSDEETSDLCNRMTTQLCAMEYIHMSVHIQKEALRQEFPALSGQTVKICQGVTRRIFRRMKSRRRRVRRRARSRTLETGDETGTGTAARALEPNPVMEVPLINQEASTDYELIHGSEKECPEPVIEFGDFDENENEVSTQATKNTAEFKGRCETGQAGSHTPQAGAATPAPKSQAIASTSTATATYDPVLESVRVAKERYEAKKRSQKCTSREHCPTLQPQPQLWSEFPEQSASRPAVASTSTGRTEERTDEDNREVIRREAVRQPKDRTEKRKRNVSDAGDTVRRAQRTRRGEERIHSVIVPRDGQSRPDIRDAEDRQRRPRSRSQDRSASRRRIESAYRQPLSRSRSREHYECRHGTFRSSRDWRPNTEQRGRATADADMQTFARQMFDMMQSWCRPEGDRRPASSLTNGDRKRGRARWPTSRK